jgi:hypothetical protein
MRHQNQPTGPREISRGPSAYGHGIVPQSAAMAMLTWENSATSIPRMFRDWWHRAAFGSLQLHIGETMIKRETAAQATFP